MTVCMAFIYFMAIFQNRNGVVCLRVLPVGRATQLQVLNATHLLWDLRSVSTTRVDGPSWRVSKNEPEFTGRQLGPWTRVVETDLYLFACVGLNWLLVSFLSHVNKTSFIQTVGETCVQCVRHSDPRHTAKRRFHYPCCDQWSAVAMRVTPARSPASTDQQCQTSCRGRLAPACCVAP